MNVNPKTSQLTDHSARRLGIVSNCWKVQLAQGQSLEELIDVAVQHGFHVIELRQGCLGEYESAVDHICSLDSTKYKLAKLSQRFPEVTFNLAVSVPCFSGTYREDDSSFLRALEAATDLAQSDCPHLRLVDTEIHAPQLDDQSVTCAANAIAAMTRKLVEAGGRLSIEHAYQSWPVYWSVLQCAKNLLGANASALQCCLDPCNLLLTEPLRSVPHIVEAIAPDDVSMIHLKQRRDDRIQPDVSNGDLDWPRLLDVLDRRGHRGPWLFEVAPHEEIWANLQRSIEYLFE